MNAFLTTASEAPLSILQRQVSGKLLLVMTLREDLNPAVKQMELYDFLMWPNTPTSSGCSKCVVWGGKAKISTYIEQVSNEINRT